MSRVPTEQAVAMAKTFKALADPTRVRILLAVIAGERCVHDLCEELELEQSTVSHQLRVLRDRQLVRNRREGRHVFYGLDDDHVRDLLERTLRHVVHAREVGGM